MTVLMTYGNIVYECYPDIAKIDKLAKLDVLLLVILICCSE